MECLSEVDCGINSVCSNISSSSNICSCKEGYFINSDFITNNNNNNIKSSCYGNEIAFYVLYSITLFVTLLTIFIYSINIKKKSQFKRLIPFYLTMCFCLILPSLKIYSFNQFNIGQNILVTLIYGLTLIFNSIAITIFLFKYVKTHYKFIVMFKKDKETNLNRNKKLLYFAILITILAFPILILSLIFSNTSIFDDDDDEDELERAEEEVKMMIILFRVYHGMISFQALILLILVYNLVGGLLTCLKDNDKGQRFASPQLTDNIYKQAIQVMKGIRNVVISTILFNSIIFLALTFSSRVYDFASYAIPFLILSCCYGCLGTLYFTRGQHYLKKMIEKAKETINITTFDRSNQILASQL